MIRFKKYVCTSPEAIKDKWNPQGCLYEGMDLKSLIDNPGCIYCGMTSDDSHTIWYKIQMMLPYWVRRPFQHPIKDISRAWRFFWQRRTRGFDDSELWSLDYTISRFVAPRLRAFIDTYAHRAVPCGVGDPSATLEERGREWIVILEKIYKAFKLMEEDDWETTEEWEAQKKEIDEGLELFKQYHRSIWD